MAECPSLPVAWAGFPDYVVPGANGLLCEAGNLESFVRAIREAGQHPVFGRGAVDETTLQQMRKYLSPETMATRFWEAYQQVLTERQNENVSPHNLPTSCKAFSDWDGTADRNGRSRRFCRRTAPQLQRDQFLEHPVGASQRGITRVGYQREYLYHHHGRETFRPQSGWPTRWSYPFGFESASRRPSEPMGRSILGVATAAFTPWTRAGKLRWSFPTGGWWMRRPRSRPPARFFSARGTKSSTPGIQPGKRAGSLPPAGRSPLQRRLIAPE